MSKPILIDAAVRDAARNSAEASLVALGVPDGIATVILGSSLVDDLLVEAFSAARVEVAAETVSIVDERPA